MYPTFGQYEKGVEVAQQMVSLDPDFAIGYLQLAFNNQFAGRLEEAGNTFKSEPPTANSSSLNFCSSDTN